MIKNIIFDVGDVLIEYRWKQMLIDYGCSEEDAVRIGAQMFDNPEKLWSTFDLGTMSDDEIIAEFSGKYPDDAKEIEWFIRHGEYMHVPRPKVWEKVHELKAKGYGIYILSNYPESLFKKHTEYADFMDDIDGMVVSYMIHKAKPEPEIYEYLCQKYGLVKSECIFFDDRIENVQGAESVGIRARHIKSQDMLLEYLKEFE